MSDALLSVEEVRHPMWTAPHMSEALTGQVRALRKEIARQLRRFDGRQDMTVPVAFCQSAYDATLSPEAKRSPAWLIGDVHLRGAISRAMLHRTKEDASKQERRTDKRDAAIIQDLTDKFVEAITREYLS